MLWILIAAAAACYLILSILIFFLSGFIAKKSGKNPKKHRQVSLGFLGAITSATFAWNWFVSPLPSDEYMIEHFNKNRAAYEELVAGYVDARSKDDAAMKDWLNSQRKIELQRLVKAKDELVSPESSQWYGGIVPGSGLGERKKLIYSIEFHIESGAANSFRERSVIWKSYMYFSDPPEQTEQGVLCGPTGLAKKCLGNMDMGLLPDLDRYPMFTSQAPWCGSYLRQIDTKWFIRYSKACL